VVSRGAVLGGRQEGEFPGWKSWGMCFQTHRGVSTVCYSCKQRILGPRVPGCCLVARMGPKWCIQGRHGILSPEWATVPLSDTCHFGIPLAYLSLSVPLCGLWASGETLTLCPLWGSWWDSVGRGEERCGKWELPGGHLVCSRSWWPGLSCFLIIVIHCMLKAFVWRRKCDFRQAVTGSRDECLG